MKIKKIIAVIVSLALVGGSVVGGIYAYQKYQEDRLVAEVVYVSDINWGYYSDSTYMYGRLTNDAAQEIYLDNGRTVETVYVAEGDEVLEGDPLIKYDTREAELEIRRKSLDIDTINNKIIIAQRTLADLRTKVPVADGTSTNVDYLEKRIDVIEREIDALLDLSERDAKDSRIYNYITEDTVPFNAAVASGTEEDPYIICCNKGAFVYGSFFQKLGNEWYGKYVQFIVVKKDANGVMITTEKEIPSSESGTPGQNKPGRPSETVISPSSGTASITKAAGKKKVTVPVADGSTSPNMVMYSHQNKPTVSDGDDMWYVFTGVQIGAELDALYDELDRLEDSESEGQSTYTAAELKEAISEQEMKIKEYDLKKRQEEVTLASLQSAAENGVVYAKADGHVKSVGDLTNREDSTRAFLVVTSDDGLYVTAAISELLLDSIEPGTVMTANSWESGMTFDATVTEISSNPTTSMWGGDGNPNVSYYEFTAYVEDSDSLRNGEYVDLTMGDEETDEDGESLFIEKAYVRKEDGKAYCMIVDENERLKKQYVATGKSFYDSIEIKAGLSEDDRIAFPYGKMAVEGALATEKME